MLRKKYLTVLSVAALAAGSVGCHLNIDSILAMQDGSHMDLTVLGSTTVIPLEGGTVMNIDVNISFFDLLFWLPIDGDVAVSDLLFAAPPFDFLGLPSLNTGDICVVSDEANPGGGTFEADVKHSTATFDVTLNTIALIGNPALAAALPGGGFTFPFALQSTIPMSFDQMLGLLTGSGNLSVTQMLDLDTIFPVTGVGNIPGHVGGEVTLSTVDAFPTSPLLDDCIAFLNQ
jgi:hypothetical protein